MRRTNVTKVSSELPTAPVTSQQPSVGNETPLAWKPRAPVSAGDRRAQRWPRGIEPATGDGQRSGSDPPPTKLPPDRTVALDEPGIGEDHATIAQTPTHRSSLPTAADDPKSRSPMSSGALPGFVTGQFLASAIESGSRWPRARWSHQPMRSEAESSCYQPVMRRRRRSCWEVAPASTPRTSC